MALVIERCWYTVTWFSQGYYSFIRNELKTNNNIYKSCFYAVIGCNSWLSSNGARKSTGIMYLCSIISSQGVFIRMKWDKLIAKDAVLVHLFLNSDVLGPRLPTAWHVHTVTAVFALGELHLFSIQMRLRKMLRFFFLFFWKDDWFNLWQSQSPNFSSSHKTYSSKMDYPEEYSFNYLFREESGDVLSAR